MESRLNTKALNSGKALQKFKAKQEKSAKPQEEETKKLKHCNMVYKHSQIILICLD